MYLIFFLLVSQINALKVAAFDTPNDDGGSITIEWQVDSTLLNAIQNPKIEIYRGQDPKDVNTLVETIFAMVNSYIDAGVKDRTPYYYKIILYQDTIPLAEGLSAEPA
ncbi:MAG: hypothetical protein ABIM20_07100, partial [candidate division WOR-3 bacterium]